MKTNIINLKKIIRKIILEMQDVPPVRQTEKQTSEPGIYNQIKNTSVFYCMWSGGKNPIIIELLLNNNTTDDLKEFAENFKEKVKGIFNINDSLERYKFHLENNNNLLLYNRIINVLKNKGFIFDNVNVEKVTSVTQ